MTKCKTCGCRTADRHTVERRYANNESTHVRTIRKCDNCGTVKDRGPWLVDSLRVALNPDLTKEA